mmetsp:Transcript_15722/g.23818  ORF Transcript_15722/g.23818 Transcript_15722/m.23818 type:complete len:246 (+) Transcript_15722:106-843(+)
MKERTVYFSIIGVASVLMIIFNQIGLSARTSVKKDSLSRTRVPTRATKSVSSNILCFGDSITTGMSPPNSELFPFALYLEHAMQQTHNVKVHNLGLPGFTANQMINDIDGEHGLRKTLKTGDSIDVVIIMAGTNDLMYTVEVNTVIDSITSLHRVCHDEGVRYTVAIGIPPSVHQSSNPEISNRAQTINDALSHYCASDPNTLFVPFPFEFQLESDLWANDGIHFSPKGYQVLGESLFPLLQKLL